MKWLKHVIGVWLGIIPKRITVMGVVDYPVNPSDIIAIASFRDKVIIARKGGKPLIGKWDDKTEGLVWEILDLPPVDL